MDKKGLTLSIIGLCLFWVPIAGLVLSIVGLVKSIKALKEAKLGNGSKGKSITGIALGGSGIGMTLIMVPVLLSVIISIILADNAILTKAKEASDSQKSSYDSYLYDYDYYDWDY